MHTCCVGFAEDTPTPRKRRVIAIYMACATCLWHVSSLRGNPLLIRCALQLGSTAIGIATKEGVVLAVEKRITSPLLVRAFASTWAAFCLVFTSGMHATARVPV